MRTVAHCSTNVVKALSVLKHVNLNTVMSLFFSLSDRVISICSAI